MYVNPDIESSYRENNIGQTFYDLVMKEKPKVIFEFGSLNGYSAVCMAMALRDLRDTCDHHGHIFSVDLWEEYPFKHSDQRTAVKNADKYAVADYISFIRGDFFKWTKEKFKNQKIDLLHVDISNDGDVVRRLDSIKDVVKTIIFEGGTAQRDNVEWMINYNKPLINFCDVNYSVLNEKFPSLSMIAK